jgi:carboxyl-terminal processing protease
MKQIMSAIALSLSLLATPVLAAETTSTRQQQVDNLGPFATCDAPVDQFVQFYDMVWTEIDASYYDVAALKDFAKQRHKYDVNLCSLDNFDKAVKLMTASLDNRWTNYISRGDIFQHNMELTQGIYPLGFELNKSNGAYHVEYIYWGSAVQQSILQEGDVVKSIDGVNLATKTVSEVQALITGPVGRKVTVVANHKGQDETMDIVIAAFRPAVIESKLIPANGGQLGYIRLPDFGSERTIEAFVKELDSLIQQGGGSLKGLILDMRGNPGGEMPAAIAAASLFLPDGSVVCTNYVRSNDKAAVNGLLGTAFKSAPANALTVNHGKVDAALVAKLRAMPLVLLVNGSTASAGEVLTGALKDNNRATIIGTKTFGKGVGFLSHNVPFGGLLSVTEMKYVTPSGYDVSDKGIDPTKVVEHAPASLSDEQLQAAIDVFGH